MRIRYLAGSIVLGGLVVLGACKQRAASSASAVKEDGTASGSVDLGRACKESGSKRYLAGQADGSILYTKKPGSKSVNGWENWNEGVATLDKEQAETPFWHLSVPFVQEDDVPFCLIGRSTLSTAELASALECSTNDPCKAVASIETAPLFAGNGDLADKAGGLALADQAGVKCDGAQLVNDGGVKIGQAIPDGLGGDKLCERLSTSLTELTTVCAFDGKGFAPYGKAKGLKAGEQDQPENLQLCSDLLRTTRGKKVCGLADREYRIYDVDAQGKGAGQAAAIDEGSFTTLEECSAFLADTSVARKGLALAGTAVDYLDLNTADIDDYYRARFSPSATPGTRHPATCVDRSADKDGFVFFRRCRVDVVYSWGPMVKIRDLERQMGVGTWNQSAPIKRFDKNTASPIFTTHSPIASHGYGEAAIRIKLKANVQYVRGNFLSTCANLSDPSTQVVERYAGRAEGNFIELIICAPGPIHSWSYFTKTQYDETALESSIVVPNLVPVNTALQGIANWPLYFKFQGKFGFLGQGIDDGTITNYRRHMFKSRLETMARNSRADRKRIYFNSDVRDLASIKSHFVSNAPFLFQFADYSGDDGDAEVGGAAQEEVGIPCSSVRGKTYKGQKRAVTLGGDCSDYTKAGVYVGANRGVANNISWTIDSSLSPARIQVEILDGPIKGDVFFYTVSDANTICFAGQTKYTGPTSSCMTAN